MDIKAELQKVRDLEQAYLKQCNATSGSLKASDAFHAWHKAMLVFFSKVIPTDNEDFRFIKNKEAAGNGAILRGIFDQISGRYEILMDEIANGKYSLPKQNEVETNKVAGAKHPLVFISHASADKAIIGQFIKDILKEGLGLRDENIACTSFEATGVTIGGDIPRYIKDNIASAQVVLAMISKAYKASEVCQNEVGAAWALGNRPLQILLPDVDFDELGWLQHLKKAARIDQQDCLDNLEEVLCDKLGINLVSPRHWNPCVSSFLAYFHKDQIIIQEAKKVELRACSVYERKGQRVLIIRNEGEATATNVQIDIENKDEYDGTLPELPVNYDELMPGAERRIILALVEGNTGAEVLFTWDDENQKENKQKQTIDL